MKLETFFEKFDQFADAPDAVAKMRELILDFAIGGHLLRTSESAELEANGGWPKQTLGSIASLITKGSTPTSYGHQYEASGIPFVKVENIADGFVNRSSMEQFISEATHEFLKRSQLESGDILFSIAGTIGKTCVVRPGDVPANTNQALAIIRGFSASFEIPFLKMQLDSFVANKVKAKARGGAMPNVSLGDLRDLLVVVPPLAEQKRIVAKVDELMALCDRLEAQQEERKTRQVALARASLARFADAPTPANLNLLFHPSYAIPPADLRKSILTLAVQGKLVEPDPTEESVDDLLDRMQKRRDQLIDAKKIRKPRELPPVAEDEPPFSVPAGWRWTRWGQICDWITYGFTRPMSHIEKGPPIVTAKNVQDGFMTFENAHRADPGEFADLNPKDLPRRGDILITKDGTIGRAAVVDTDEPFCINQSVAVLWLESCLLYRPFLLMVIRSPFAQGPIWEAAEGMAIKHLSITDFGRMILPLPPLAEQRRIVAKVEQLMALVDALEQQLADARATAEKLLTALVQELTSAR